jgi:hypothetical protein
LKRHPGPAIAADGAKVVDPGDVTRNDFVQRFDLEMDRAAAA